MYDKCNFCIDRWECNGVCLMDDKYKTLAGLLDVYSEIFWYRFPEVDLINEPVEESIRMLMECIDSGEPYERKHC